MRAPRAFYSGLLLVAGAMVVPCFGVAMAEPIGSGGSRAPLELTTRGMLLQRWDRNRDGKIDLGEAEMARTQMRRERVERAERSRIDPITGRRPADLFGDDEDDGSDLFGRRSSTSRQSLTPPGSEVPGLGQTAKPLPGSGLSATGRSETQPGIDAASPTMTFLGPPSGLPSATGSQAAADAPLSSAARVLPQTSGLGSTGGLNAGAPIGGSRPFERPTAPLGSALTGGIRAGAPAVRPGYGTSGTTKDLNAGRLLGGAPRTGGAVPQPGGSNYRGFVPRGTSTLNAGRPASSSPASSRPPTTPRPGSTPTDFYGP